MALDSRADYDAGLTPVAGVYPDAANKMISNTQFKWLTDNIAAATTTWQIIGNQDIMAKLWYPQSVVAAFAQGTAAFGAAVNTYLTGPRTEFKIPINMDSWDGYPIQRETLLKTIKATGKKLVVLSGDSHNAWFNNLKSLDGTSQIGVEFATTSVTAPGFESAGLGGLASTIDGTLLTGGVNGTGMGLVGDVNYSDTQRRGYLLMTVTAANVKGEFVFVDNIKTKTYATTVGKTVTVAAANLAVSYS